MCSQKNFEALAETADGHVSLSELRGQRTTVVPDPPAEPGDASVSESPGSMHHLAATTARTDSNAGALWLSQDHGLTQARGLERGQKTRVSAVSRRRADAASALASASQGNRHETRGREGE